MRLINPHISFKVRLDGNGYPVLQVYRYLFLNNTYDVLFILGCRNTFDGFTIL